MKDSRDQPEASGAENRDSPAALTGPTRQVLDPVAERFLADLTARADVQSAAVRRVLATRLPARLAAIGAGASGSLPPPVLASEHRQAPWLSPFPALLARLASGAGATNSDDIGHAAQHAKGVVGGALAQGELKALRYFRNDWAQLNVDRQMARALAREPENAGPLNSQRLIAQSLRLMRETSPDYLQRFMAYAEALIWLEGVDQAPEAKRERRRGRAVGRR